MRIKEACMHLKKQKCAFVLPAVEYLGQQMSAEELRPMQERAVQTLNNALKKSTIDDLETQLRQ